MGKMLILSASVLSYPSQLDPVEDPDDPIVNPPVQDPELVYNTILYKKGQTDYYTDSRDEATDAGGITSVLFMFNRGTATSKTVTAQRITGFKMLHFEYVKVNTEFPIVASSMGFLTGDYAEDTDTSTSFTLSGQLLSGCIGYNKGVENGTVVLSDDEVDLLIAQFPDKYTVTYS